MSKSLKRLLLSASSSALINASANLRGRVLKTAEAKSRVGWTMSVQLTARPTVGLVDDRVHVLVTELAVQQPVTLVAIITEMEMTFISVGRYVSDDEGRVDLQTATSVGGTYTGVEPMGFLWSLKPASGQRSGLRLRQRDVASPLTVELYLIDGHVQVLCRDDLQQHSVLSQLNLKRYYQAPGVTAVPVREGSLRGMLFLPPGAGPFPGVIDMFGTSGGLTVYRAALLASRGFAALALAIFGFDDLPPNIELQMEYFRDAADWLHAHPLVLKQGIGITGTSKGAALAIQMAILNAKVKAVVAINPYCCHCIGIHYLNGKQQPVVNADVKDFCDTSEGLVFKKAFIYTETNKDAIIQVEKAESASFLFVVGEDDETSDTRETQILIDRLKHRSSSSSQGATRGSYERLSYPGAGHLIEPPYAPHGRACYTKLIGMIAVYGGETKGHSIAQEDSWREILRFLRHHLNPQQTQTSSSLKRLPSSVYSKL